MADFVTKAPTSIQTDDRDYANVADRELGFADLAIDPAEKRQQIDRAAHFATLGI